jgi:hypothetical protein
MMNKIDLKILIFYKIKMIFLKKIIRNSINPKALKKSRNFQSTFKRPLPAN